MYFIFKISWSQTDQPKIIVKADTLEAAKKFVEERYGDAFYREMIGSTEVLHEV